MKRFLNITLALLIMIAIVSANPSSVLASEGDDEHVLEAEVNGYHVTLTSENDWAKGENIVVVTLADGMGMPLSNADVEIIITAKSDDHAEAETDTHDAEPQEESMPGMDMGEPAEETQSHEEETADPIAMIESDMGMYTVETHLESSGENEVHVLFHVDGEMFQADFVIESPATSSKTVVLWSFVVVNMALITSAGIMKKQSIPVKGTR